jgi:Zn-dependent M28 family amino/carboxypeptidase
MRRRPGIYRSLSYALVLALMLGGGIMYMTNMPGKSWSGVLPPLTMEQERLAKHLRKHIAVLSEEIGERNLWRNRTLDATADYIEKTLQAAGYTVSSQVYTVQGTSVRNLEAVHGGTSLAEEIVLIGAHYDTFSGSPGANDNASGVAALIEIARLLAAKTLARSVRFVAFVNEEAPFFYTWKMGSHRYARQAHEHGDNITAMLSLETIGYYSDADGSQQYPNPVYAWLYPNTGNFIGFVGNLASRKLVRQCLGSFRRHSAFPSEGIAAPGRMMGIHWSDHWSFWQEGYAAVMVTDTALFRYPHYHASTDLPDRIDYERLARVVEGLAKMTVDLAQQQ